MTVVGKTDSDKLREIATWFDLIDDLFALVTIKESGKTIAETLGTAHGHEMQADLRRIADNLDN